MVFSLTATGNSLYAAKHFSDAPEFTARLAAEAGVRADHVSAIQMVDNYLPVFDLDEQRALDKRVEEQLSAAVQAVSRQERGIPASTGEGRKLHAQVTAKNREQPPSTTAARSRCWIAASAAGSAARWCPVDNFYLEGGRAKRKQSTCEFCLACAQNCPQKAIGLRLADKNPRALPQFPHLPAGDHRRKQPRRKRSAFS